MFIDLKIWERFRDGSKTLDGKMVMESGEEHVG